MPWHIDDSHADCEDGFAVILDEDDSLVKCHETEEAAQQHMAALYASETKAEDAQAAKEKRAEKYGIGAKEGKPVTKPAKFSDVAEDDFGDPVNYAYPADAEHARAAIGYFNRDGQREAGSYISKEWGIIGKRLAEQLSRHLDADYEYSAGKLQRKEEAKKLKFECVNCGHIVMSIENCLDILCPECGTETKAGRVLSSVNARRIVNALTTLIEVLEAAGIDIPGVGKEEAPTLEPFKSTELKSAYAIKLISETDDYYTVGGYGHVWGDAEHKDLAGDYFTPDSELMSNLVPQKLIFFDHTLGINPDGERFDNDLGLAAENETKIDNVGKWVQAQLDKRKKYVEAVMILVKEGVLAWSSGAVPHLVKRAKDGWLKRWPVAEFTLTTTPCEPRHTNINQLRMAYKAAGLELLLQEAKTETAQGPQSDGGQDDASKTEHNEALAQRLALEHERTRIIER